MTNVRVPVSVGELVDKMTILRIKKERITDHEKLRNIEAELEVLEKVYEESGLKVSESLVSRLQEINSKLWDIEDEIREKERAQQFDGRFIELARSVYVTNDERFGVKSEINEQSGSQYREEKSYREYR